MITWRQESFANQLGGSARIGVTRGLEATHLLVHAGVRGGRLLAGSAVATAVVAGLEAVWIRSHVHARQPEFIPHATGTYGTNYPGPVLKLAIFGDSNAAGVGATRSSQTIPALLGRGLSAAQLRPVRLENVAESGAETRDLDGQITRLPADPDVALIVIGGNDVVHLRRIWESAAQLDAAVRRLRDMGTEVVVATCPDMGTIRALVPPLRWIARWHSRVLAAAQTIVALRAGGRTVSIGDMLGPLYAENPEGMFSTDRFHSSPLGYATAARLLLPSICAAAGGGAVAVPRRICHHDPRPTVDALAFRSVHHAAAEALRLARPARGRWAAVGSWPGVIARSHSTAARASGAVAMGRTRIAHRAGMLGSRVR